MALTLDQLRGLLRETLAQRERAQAQFHQADGARQVLEHLIAAGAEGDDAPAEAPDNAPEPAH